jgi:hypothetical protein
LDIARLQLKKEKSWSLRGPCDCIRNLAAESASPQPQKHVYHSGPYSEPSKIWGKGLDDTKFKKCSGIRSRTLSGTLRYMYVNGPLLHFYKNKDT